MIDYAEGGWLFMLVFRVYGLENARKACWFGVPSSCLALIFVLLDRWFPDFRYNAGVLDLDVRLMWTACTATITTLIVFRTNKAFGRFWEGTTLLHQMRGEWYDTISCLCNFSRGAMASKAEEVKIFRATIVRLMSLAHGFALEEMALHEQSHGFSIIDICGLDADTLRHIKSAGELYGFDRVFFITHMLRTVMTKAIADGVISVPPPVMSRTFQTLSRGLVALLNARKIADTKFPFPYVFLITLLCHVHAMLTPLLFSSIINSYFWAPFFTFFPIFGFWSLNFIAI